MVVSEKKSRITITVEKNFKTILELVAEWKGQKVGEYIAEHLEETARKDLEELKSAKLDLWADMMLSSTFTYNAIENIFANEPNYKDIIASATDEEKKAIIKKYLIQYHKDEVIKYDLEHIFDL